MTPAELDSLDQLLATATRKDHPPCDCGGRLDGGCFTYCARASSASDTHMAQSRVREALVAAAPALLTLARRGLRADEEVCGRCASWKWLVFDGEHACELRLNVNTETYERTRETDYCSRFRAKEGG